MQEYLTECLAKERVAWMHAFAARQRLLREARPARRGFRTALGMGLIRAGQLVLRGMPEWTAEPHSHA